MRLVARREDPSLHDDHPALPTMHTSETELLADVAAVIARPRRTLRSAARAALVGGAAMNAALFALLDRAGLFPDWVLMPGTLQPLGVVRVVVSTVAGIGAGLGVFALLRRRVADPRRLFDRVALAVLVLSFTQPPMVLRDAPVRMWVALCVLHVAATIALLGALRDVEPAGGER
jgi:hypothetical protein